MPALNYFKDFNNTKSIPFAVNNHWTTIFLQSSFSSAPMRSLFIDVKSVWRLNFRRHNCFSFSKRNNKI